MADSDHSIQLLAIHQMRSSRDFTLTFMMIFTPSSSKHAISCTSIYFKTWLRDLIMQENREVFNLRLAVAAVLWPLDDDLNLESRNQTGGEVDSRG